MPSYRLFCEADYIDRFFPGAGMDVRRQGASVAGRAWLSALIEAIEAIPPAGKIEPVQVPAALRLQLSGRALRPRAELPFEVVGT